MRKNKELMYIVSQKRMLRFKNILLAGSVSIQLLTRDVVLLPVFDDDDMPIFYHFLDR